MPRTRLLKPEFFDDVEVGLVSMAARLTFAGLWCWADREGRLEDEPARIRARLFPYDVVDMDALLVELATKRLIARYDVDGHAYIQIRTFTKHQHPHPREVASTIPEQGQATPRRGLGKTQALTSRAKALSSPSVSDPVSDPDPDPVRTTSCPEPPSAASGPDEPTAPPVLSFPTVGTGSGQWDLTHEQVTEWHRLFPDLDIDRQCKAALAWVQAKSSRRKTAKGMPAFLVGWLGRSTDNPRTTNGHGTVTFSAQAEADTREGLAEYRRRQLEPSDARHESIPAGAVRVADLGLGALVRRIR